LHVATPVAACKESRGDADGDGFCNIVGLNDNCPGVDDFSPACGATRCAKGDLFSSDCPDLPWRGGGGGNGAARFTCPNGGYAVGMEMDTYDTNDLLGARIICKDPMGNFSYQGKYGSTCTPDTTPAYEVRCDSVNSDARLVGAISTVYTAYMGRAGIICSSETAGMIWRVEPVGTNSSDLIYTDVCTGPHEVVTSINIKTGCWCDRFQLGCTSMP
jgi:hypothetical protein